MCNPTAIEPPPRCADLESQRAAGLSAADKTKLSWPAEGWRSRDKDSCRRLILAIDEELEFKMPLSPQPTWRSSVSRHVKWIALTILFFQNSATSLIMPLAQKGAQWNSQSGVIVQEAIKGAVSALMLLQEGGLPALREALRPSPEALKTGVPALLFLVQNNLQYVAAKYLDPTTFAVLYQLKTLTTALLSVMMLGKRLGLTQWVALFVLVGGAVCMVLDRAKPTASDHPSEHSILPGVVAVLTSCFFSGLAGVYFEKILKGSTVSLAARNVQLAFYSSVIGLMSWYQSGGSDLSFFFGYTPYVWLSVCNNAFGGLLVAVVVKYADNILKNIANTLAIVNTTLVSILFMGGSLGPQSTAGVSLVICATCMYADMCSADSISGAADCMLGRCASCKVPCLPQPKARL